MAHDIIGRKTTATYNSPAIYQTWHSVQLYYFQKVSTVRACNGICRSGQYLLDPLQNCWVSFTKRFIPPNQAEMLFNVFKKADFKNAHVGRSVLWFGPIDYTYGATTLKRQELDSNRHISKFAVRLSEVLGVRFNSCLVNSYEDEKSFVPKHSDDESLFGIDPTIASLSIGETRRFILEPSSKYGPKSIKSKYTFLLQSGDLLVMKGQTQRYWVHSVPQETYPCSPRFNLTFRRVVGY